MASALIGAKFRAWANDGTPLAFGKVYTYETGTTVPKVTYTTEAQTTPNANPVILNASGYADIYLDGSYKIVVKDADNVEIHTTDPVSDPSNVGASATLRNADTIQDLLAINPAVISSVLVIDYHGDVTGGGGNFVWDATAVKNTHNGGTIIDPDVTYPTNWTNQAQLTTWFDGSANVTTGCWIRKYDGAVNVRMFGTKGDGAVLDTLALDSVGRSFSASSTVDIEFNAGDVHKLSVDTGLTLNAVNGYRLMSFRGKTRIDIVGNGAKLLLVNHNIGAAGYGFSTIIIEDSSNVCIKGLYFDLSYIGSNNSASLYPLCEAIGLDYTASASRNINITDNYFKMFHPWGQYATTSFPYAGDPNNGFKILPVFIKGDNTQTNSKLLTNDVNVLRNTFVDGHNGYGIWVWSCSDVKINENIAESWSGKVSSYNGTTGTQVFGSIPFIRCIQFYADNLEICNNVMYGRPLAAQTTGYEGNSNFISVASSLTTPVYTANVLIDGNYAELEGDTSALAGNLSAVDYSVSGNVSVTNNTFNIVSKSASHVAYGFMDSASTDRSARHINITGNKLSTDVTAGGAGIYLANGSATGNDAYVVIADNTITGIFDYGVTCGAAVGAVYGVTSLIAANNVISGAGAAAFNINNNKNVADMYCIAGNAVSGTLANKTWTLSNKVYITPDNIYATFGNAVTENTTLAEYAVFKNPTGSGKLAAESSGAGRIWLEAQDSTQYIGTTGACSFLPGAGALFVHPNADNTVQLGKAAQRWSVVFAGTGTINTSDDREKTFLTVEAAEKQVATELKGLMKKFQFNSAIAIKGVDGARIHYGTSAQSVKATFEKYGLDAMRYSMICYDEWDTIPAVLAPDGSVLAEEQPAGNRYGIRYEELLCFIISAL